ncbi:MAG: class I SAM-dependent methyltransferase [Planctomycetota bacterium]
MTAACPDWWNHAFRSAYLEVYHHRDDAQAAAEVAGLLPRLRQLPGPVIDAGCGAARHLHALRAAGIPAFGFELSADLIAVAQQRPACRGNLVRADLRAPPFTGDWGVVLCLFTVFGYYDDAGNQACLAVLGKMLAADGRLVLDLPDPAEVQRTLCPRSKRTTPRGWIIEETRRLVGQRVEKKVVATPPGGQSHTWQECVRLYDAEELARMAALAGLRIDAIWNGLRGPQSPEGRLVAWLAPVAGR